MFKTFSTKERILFYLFFLIFVGGFVWWSRVFYYRSTVEKPVPGGELIEAVVGSPRYINPILADTSEGDSVLEALIFSSLFRVDTRGGVEPDLVQDVTVSESRKEYFVTLRDGLKWHDGDALDADDVIFTLSLIQNPAMRSPLAVAWQGVGSEKVSQKTIKFVLEEPYEFFLQNLTFRILPKHIWTLVPFENIQLAEFNIRPIGSGPYRFRSFEKDKLGTITQYTLSANPAYHHSKPYIGTIKLRFFKDKDEAILAVKSREVDSMAGVPLKLAGSFDKPSFSLFRLTMPLMYAVFFNTDAALLKDSSVRFALVASVAKDELTKEVIGGEGRVGTGPIPPGIAGALLNEDAPKYDLAEANARLEKAGWRDIDGDGIRDKKLSKNDKNPKKLSLKLIFPLDPNHERTAEILRDFWRAAGIEAEIAGLDVSEITSAIRSRSYDIILFGTLLSQNPDIFPFWHSSQALHPGLNLSRFGAKKVDDLIVSSRRETSLEKRNEKLIEAQKLILKENPALFLYSPHLLYVVSPKIKFSVEPSLINMPEERFSRVNEWFISTKRVWRR